MASSKVLVFNAGSASLKFDVIEADAEQASPHDGHTTVSGLVMGMRSGDIDPALVGYIACKEKLDVDGVEKLLNKNRACLKCPVSRMTREF